MLSPEAWWYNLLVCTFAIAVYIPNIIFSMIAHYIENQKQHHKKQTFIEEYIDFLKAFKIEYDERYIYKPIE